MSPLQVISRKLMSASSQCQHQSKWTVLTFVCGTLFCKLGRDENVGFHLQSKFWRTWPESLATVFGSILWFVEWLFVVVVNICLLYTSDAADELD
eukprot:5502874-Ditylum_brightwellii.AAC.1